MKQVRGWMLFVTGLVTGFALGYFDRQLLTLTWKGEIGIGDLFNFINTIIFAFLLQQYVTKRIGDKRAEKDHVIVLIKESIKWIEGVRNKFLICYNKNTLEKSDEQEIKALIKNFANSLSHIRLGLKHCNYNEDSLKKRGFELLYFIRRQRSEERVDDSPRLYQLCFENVKVDVDCFKNQPDF